MVPMQIQYSKKQDKQKIDAGYFHLFNARRVMPAAQILPKVNKLFHMVCDCDDSEK